MTRDDDWLRRLIEAKIDPKRHPDLPLDALWSEVDSRADALLCQWYAIERDEPQAAWRIVELACEMNLPREELELIGADIFETLMYEHGADFIDRVEIAAATSTEMRIVVGAAWTYSMTPNIAARIEVIQRGLQ